MKFIPVLLLLIVEVTAHGRLRDPPARSSAWRYGFNTPANYDDTELFCGGFQRQHEELNGKCGICGDPYDQPEPRDNELGGKFALGIITRTYKKGQVIDTWIDITNNHLGWYELRLCPLKKDGKDGTQECFDKYILERADGKGTRIQVPMGQYQFKIQMKLPAGLTCDHCVMQWDWITGNRWGDCDNGTGALGCGPQETFRGCADIKIE